MLFLKASTEYVRGRKRASAHLRNVASSALYSLLCLVLNREAAENIGRIDKNRFTNLLQHVIKGQGSALLTVLYVVINFVVVGSFSHVEYDSYHYYHHDNCYKCDAGDDCLRTD